MRFVDDGNAVPWPRRGPVGNLLLYVTLLLAILASPALAYFAYVDNWGRLAVVVSLAMTVAISGYYCVVWVSFRRDQQRGNRLATAGIQASAKILASQWCIVNEENGVALTLQVTGPGFEPFRTVHRTEEKPGHEVGARLAALVDPVDNTTYAITG